MAARLRHATQDALGDAMQGIGGLVAVALILLLAMPLAAWPSGFGP
jgi:hypothetical protein